MTKQRNKIFKTAFLLLLLISPLYFTSCEKEPSDLGIIYLPPDDTTGTNVLESQADTMLITSSNFDFPVNTSVSDHIIIGRNNGYESRGFLKFTSVTGDYDSANIISANLVMRYDNYYFRDSSGTLAFDVYRLTRDINFGTATIDSISSSDIGTTSVGSYSGNPQDTGYIGVQLDNQLVKDWLEYAANSSYQTPNYGIAFVPNGGSNTMKGFYSSRVEDNRPYVDIILSKNNDIDTISITLSTSMFTTSASSSVIPQDRFIVQSGVAFRNILGFDLRKLPSNVIINDVKLELTLDRQNSFLTSGTNSKLGFSIVTDSVNKTDTLQSIPANQSVNGDVYTVKITPVVQYWNSGVLTNLGTAVFTGSERLNTDVFTFYAPSYSDPTKVPKLRIIYTLRN
jgi:hypothetical protein